MDGYYFRLSGRQGWTFCGSSRPGRRSLTWRHCRAPTGIAPPPLDTNPPTLVPSYEASRVAFKKDVFPFLRWENVEKSVIKGIVQPFELGGETRLIRSAVK
jgi:hypothetical protein